MGSTCDTSHSGTAAAGAQLADLHEMTIKAALRDQDLAGIDIVSDGELRRDNDCRVRAITAVAVP
jgi:methionine synthase II (cobalamin-independent)